MTTTTDNSTFASFGKGYQEKVVSAVIQDSLFADQISDVMEARFFELNYLQVIVEKIYEHKNKFKTFPSSDIISVMVKRDENLNETVTFQVEKFLKETAPQSLGGDMMFIQESSLDFCKKQTVKAAMLRAIDAMESQDYDSINKILKDALNKGASRDLGHDYINGMASRVQSSNRKPVKTPWPVIDKALNGGWERGTLTTFIAPTGAGKSMFLTNVTAACVANGMNGLYISLEMADYKIGLRHDAYFSGIAINEIVNNVAKVEADAQKQVTGRLYIKEFPTKSATVQTIRAYIQRLIATKAFVPDVVVIDYADLLRSARSYGEKRHELEGVYEDLRALAQEFNVVLVTADQTNRAGLNEEVVTLQSIAEAYSKATVCDLIITISRRPADKQAKTGRLFIAKSRLGVDGVVYPFILDTATVKVRVLEQMEDPFTAALDDKENLKSELAKRITSLRGNTAEKTNTGS